MNGNAVDSGDRVRTCAREECRNELEGRRADAEYCSDACRAAAWRKERRDELAKLEREIQQLVGEAFAKARAAFGLED